VKKKTRLVKSEKLVVSRSIGTLGLFRYHNGARRRRAVHLDPAHFVPRIMQKSGFEAHFNVVLQFNEFLTVG
jgi:hypothetical protein